MSLRELIRSGLLYSGAILVFGSGAASSVAAAPAMHAPTEQTAVFAGGCFWGVDALFKHVSERAIVLLSHIESSSTNRTPLRRDTRADR